MLLFTSCHSLDTCDTGLKPCSGFCIDLQTNSKNCGVCGAVCATGSGCVAGACAVDPKFGCDATKLLCDQVCVDAMTDVNNCGTCHNACGVGASCMAGVCVDPCSPLMTCTIDGTSSCIDVTTTSAHCGGCDTVCPTAQSCSAGVCTCPASAPDACGAGSSLVCVDMSTDGNNCGGCGNVCGANKICTSGACACSCPGGSTQCGQGASCYCAELAIDALNCHACGAACASGAICTGAGCVCLAGKHACGTSCVDLTNDTANCGACNVACNTESGQSCVNGMCKCSGAQPLTCSNHCVDVAVNVNHCGDCTTQCSGSSTCSGGHCTCDGSAIKVSCGNACVDLSSDAANCGGCGSGCGGGESCFDRGCKASSTQGTLAVLGGNPSTPGNGDGIAGAATFRNPLGVTADQLGNVFVADSTNNIIRQIVIATQQVTTLAGTAGVTGSVDSTGAAASFRAPVGVTCDDAGNVYVAELGNRTIRQIVVATGNVTTLAGTALASGTTDGVGSVASFELPRAMAFDGNGNLWVSDQGAGSIRKIVLGSQLVSTLATGLNQPEGIVADGAGNLFVALSGDSTIDKVVISSGHVSVLAGAIGVTGSHDATSVAATFNHPTGLALDGAGDLFVADYSNALIRKIVLSSGAVTTVVGSGSSMLTLGPLPGSIITPSGLAVTPSGGLVIGDGLDITSNGNCILIAYP